MDYLTGVLGGLDRSQWRWVAYEDVCSAHRRGEHAAVAAALSDFLCLPAAMLERSFARFRPSRKNAADEMPASTLEEIRALEGKCAMRWFPATLPGQRLLGEFGDLAAPATAPGSAPPDAIPTGTGPADAATQQAFMRLLEALDAAQRKLWVDVHQASDGERNEKISLCRRH
eukprot:SRR837773.26271.p1 GENE.SRR837773.26271~~SRR837773.26271.p1  ORF type:complete len:180 (+),score=27.89 SRR837773.26271:27-542(+)